MSESKKAWGYIMVDGFAAPCMLGAMGIIFVAFLAPSGNNQRRSVFLPHRARVLCFKFLVCCSLARALGSGLLAESDIICLAGTGTFVIANYQNEQSDKERSGVYGAGKRD